MCVLSSFPNIPCSVKVVIAQKSLFAGESDLQIYVLEQFLKLTPDFIIMQERSLFLVVFMSVLCVLRESAVTDADQGSNEIVTKNNNYFNDYENLHNHTYKQVLSFYKSCSNY